MFNFGSDLFSNLLKKVVATDFGISMQITANSSPPILAIIPCSVQQFFDGDAYSFQNFVTFQVSVCVVVIFEKIDISRDCQSHLGVLFLCALAL